MRTMGLAAVVVLVCVSAGAAVAGGDFWAYETLREGRRAMRGGDPEEASKAFSLVMREVPDSPEAAQAAIETGRICQERGDTEDAEAMYAQASRCTHARWAAEGELALGESYLKRKIYTKAVARAGAVAETHRGEPLEGRAWVLRGRVRAAEGFPQEAQALIDRAVERYPDERWAPSALLALVEIWLPGDRVRAETAYQRLRLGYPRSPEAMDAMYLLSVPPEPSHGRPTAEQMHNLEWLVALCPDHDLVARAIWTLSVAHERASRAGRRPPSEAERVLWRYFQWDWPEFEPWRPKARLRLAELLRTRDFDEKAADELEALLDDYPDAPEIAEARAMLGAMRPVWGDVAAALDGTGAQLLWDGESEFAWIRLQETYSRYAPGYAARDKARRTLRIGLQAGRPYAVVWGKRVGIGWGPRVQEGRYLMSRVHLAELLARHKIELAEVPAIGVPKSEVAELLDRAHEIRDDDPHAAFRLYDEVARKWPSTTEAAHARFDIARFKYDRAGDLDEARRRYQALASDFPRSDWAARARIRLAEMEGAAGRIGQALMALRRVAADFAGSPLHADALLAEARLHSARREHRRAQQVCARIADAFPGLPVAAEALQLAGYSGLWSDGSLEHFCYFQRLIGDYPDTAQAADAVYYANWHGREFLRRARDNSWVPVYDPEPNRYVRRLSGGFGSHDPNFVYLLASLRGTQVPQPGYTRYWRTSSVVSLAGRYRNEGRYASALETLTKVSEEDLKATRYQGEEAERLKKNLAEPDLIALNERSGEIDPRGRLEWDWHSEEAVFVAGDGVRLHLREGDDFGWAGREIGIRWRVRVDDGNFLVSKRGLVEALRQMRREALRSSAF